MKRIFNLATVATAAILMASCTKDATEIMNPDNAGSNNKFTFVLPTQSGIITYGVAAEGNESALNLANSAILMFNNESSDANYKKLEAVITGSNIKADVRNGKPTAEIEVDDTWAGDKMFYIIGNTDMGASALPTDSDVAAGTYEIDNLLALMTDAQSGAISSTNGLLLSGSVPVADVETTSEANITLYRSVARFDIDQDVTANHVTIKSIDVVNANDKGYIVGYGKNASSTLTASDKMDVNNIAVSQTTTSIEVGKDINNDPIMHDFQKEIGVMYLYPTHLKALNAEGTVITLVGEDKYGASKIYTLNKEDSNFDIEDCEIQANYRYIISAIDPLNLTFIITVAEWDEGEPIVGRPGVDVNGFTLAAKPVGTAVSAYSNGLLSVNTTGGIIEFTVMSSSSKGTDWNLSAVGFTDDTGSYDVLETPSTVVTYGIPYFASKYTIDVTDLTEGKGSTTKLTITDKADSDAVIEIRLYHVGTGSKLITIDETLFPDATLRDYVENELGLSGEVTSDELDAVTSIDLSESNASSLEGIENFPNLKILNANGATGINGILDLSTNPELERVNLSGTNISGIDISENTKLVQLNIGNTNITTIDFESESLRILSTWNPLNSANQSEDVKINLTKVDLTKMPSLDTVNLNYANINCPVTFPEPNIIKHMDWSYSNFNASYPIDFSQLTNLIFLKFRYTTGIKSLDLTQSPAMTILNVPYCDDLEIVNIEGLCNLTYIAVSGTKVKDLDISASIGCKTLYIGYLTTLNLTVWSDFDRSTPLHGFDSFSDGGTTITYLPEL